MIQEEISEVKTDHLRLRYFFNSQPKQLSEKNVIATQSKYPNPPLPQAINSDPSQSSLMQLNRIDLQKLK